MSLILLMNNFWKDKKVLITGHTGFKGSWLVLMLKSLDAQIFGISSEKREGVYQLTSLDSLLNKELFLDLSIDNPELKQNLKSFAPDIIFHFAAQSLVIDGYRNPSLTVKTNIIAPINLIETIKECSLDTTFVIATTDKVYKHPSKDNVEGSELGGTDFYSTSKVSKELIIDSYINHPDYKNINFNKVRSGNVIGGGERANNRLFTDLIYAINNNMPIELRNPEHVRPWQYVLDSLYGYLLVAENSYMKQTSQTFNLNSEINNKYSVFQISELFKQYADYKEDILVNNNSPYKEVEILKINSSKAENDLGWKAKIEIPRIIQLIVQWEKHHKKENSPEYSLNEVGDYLNL